MIGKVGSVTPTIDKTDYYQSLIDRIFTDKNVKAKTLATTPPAPGGGAQTVTVPGGGAQTGTAPGGVGGGTTTVGGTTTGPATPGGAVTGGTGTGGSGGTEPGTGSGGGTGTVSGGDGGVGNIGFGIGGIGGGGFTIPRNTNRTNSLVEQDQTGGIKNLTAGLTERTNYELSGLSSDEDKENPMYNAPQMIQQMATGGSPATGFSTIGSSNYDPFSTTDTTGKSSISSSLTPSLTKAQINYILTGLPDYLQSKAEGGHIEGHNPQFYSEGGLNSLENRYVKGDGDGTSDDVPAMLANGEFVIPADVVSRLGNGSNDAGANVLDEFLQVIREHAQKQDPKELPPDSKGALAYLEEAQQRAEA